MLKIANDLIYNLPLEKKHRFPMLKYKLLPDLLIKEGTCLLYTSDAADE